VSSTPRHAFLDAFDWPRGDLAGELSHGEQQWLEIAMALARAPKLLLLDEPTAGMSPQERRATGELLMPIKQTCSLLIVEHDLDFIKDICDTPRCSTTASDERPSAQANER
jgi:ABC-type uncharacterized transport system ATPase subunit